MPLSGASRAGGLGAGSLVDLTPIAKRMGNFIRLPVGSAARHGFSDGLLLSKLGEWWRALLSSYREQAGQGSSR
jgi:hypothetical protein